MYVATAVHSTACTMAIRYEWHRLIFSSPSIRLQPHSDHAVAAPPVVAMASTPWTMDTRVWGQGNARAWIRQRDEHIDRPMQCNAHSGARRSASNSRPVPVRATFACETGGIAEPPGALLLRHANADDHRSTAMTARRSRGSHRKEAHSAAVQPLCCSHLVQPSTAALIHPSATRSLTQAHPISTDNLPVHSLP